MKDRNEYLNQLAGHRPGDPPVTNTDIPQVEVSFPPTYRVVGFWHISPSQNMSGHNVHVDVLAQDGTLLAPPIDAKLCFDWLGMSPEETPQPAPFEKNPPEPAANVPIFMGQRMRIWIEGGAYHSDRMSELHTMLPGAGGGNSWGHHSYYVVFQMVEKASPPPPAPTVEGTIVAYTNLRPRPGLTSDVLAVIPPGTEVQIGEGPVLADGLDWYNVASPYGQGWVAHYDPYGNQLLLLPGETLDEPVSPRLASPVPPGTPITQEYGAEEEDYSRFGLRGHNGIDYGCPVGTPVTATDDGVVGVHGIDEDGYGIWVKVDHQWGESLYAHLSEILVTTGQSVSQGEPIAKSGDTGNSTGPHLHFGIRLDGYDAGDGWGGYSPPQIGG